jgi:hypothetical protein
MFCNFFIQFLIFTKQTILCRSFRSKSSCESVKCLWSDSNNVGQSFDLSPTMTNQNPSAPPTQSNPEGMTAAFLIIILAIGGGILM